jgi:TRAP transporter TAXI family solute receptor
VTEPQQNVTESEIDQALADYFSRCDSGSALDREQFLAQYSPALRERLNHLLSVADWIEQLSTPPNAESLPLASLGEPSQLSVGDSAPQIDPHSDTLPIDPALKDRRVGSGRQLSQPTLPCKFGDYELLRVLGRGGMGVVYYAKQLHLDRPVAVKMIRSGALASEEEVQRFYTEARSAARLNHPRIVRVYHCGQQNDHHYFSMDYIEGTDLDRLARQGRMDEKTAPRYVRDAAEAIQYAHDHGILHRDLKPANVLIDQRGEIHITDFGLAKNVGIESGLTATGAALGTPSYMSPEQAAGKNHEQSQATDVYSLGAILYTILLGEPPFRGENVLQTLLQVIHRPAPRIRAHRPEIAEDLETIVDVCLQKSPNKRYASAAELALDLDRFIRGVPITARPISKWRRAWYWLLGVPVIGAILDNRVVEPTETHRWVQRGMISAGSLMLLAWLMLLASNSVWLTNRMPNAIRVAAGAEGGQYNLVGKTLVQALSGQVGSKIELFSTQGSSENVEFLSQGKAHLALMQADLVDESSVAVIAPLYYEVVHLLIRQDLEIVGIEDLRNQRVYLGNEKAGSRITARRLLNYSGVALEDITVVDELPSDAGLSEALDAAILVTRAGATEIERLLTNGQFRLMSLPNAWEFALAEPSFHFIYLGKDDYPNSLQEDRAISSVAATAYLVCNPDAPDVLVNQVLSALYSPELMRLGVMTAEQAAHWQGIAWHPAARAFFRAYRGGQAK